MIIVFFMLGFLSGIEVLNLSLKNKDFNLRIITTETQRAHREAQSNYEINPSIFFWIVCLSGCVLASESAF